MRGYLSKGMKQLSRHERAGLSYVIQRLITETDVQVVRDTLQGAGWRGDDPFLCGIDTRQPHGDPTLLAVPRPETVHRSP